MDTRNNYAGPTEDRLIQAVFRDAPPVFGQPFTLETAEELVKLLNETTMNPSRVVSKGQAIKLNHQLTARLGVAIKEVNRLQAELATHIAFIDSQGNLKSQVSAETLYPVLAKYAEELAGVVAAEKAEAEAKKPALSVVPKGEPE